MLEIDEKTTLKSWTIMETIVGLTGLVCAIVISLFFLFCGRFHQKLLLLIRRKSAKMSVV